MSVKIPKRIVCFGASTIYGRGDPEGGGFVTRLRLWHEGNARSNAVFNLGIDGERTEQMLQRFLPEVRIRRPDLIVLFTGLNDFRREGSEDSPRVVGLDRFRGNINELVKSAKSICPTIMIGPFPIDQSKTRPIRQEPAWYLLADAEEINITSRDICRQIGVEFIDIFEEWGGQPKPEMLYADGLHLNSAGHQWLLVLLQKRLAALFS